MPPQRQTDTKAIHAGQSLGLFHFQFTTLDHCYIFDDLVTRKIYRALLLTLLLLLLLVVVVVVVVVIVVVVIIIIIKGYIFFNTLDLISSFKYDFKTTLITLV